MRLFSKEALMAGYRIIDADGHVMEIDSAK
jgi:hypothetical protein